MAVFKPIDRYVNGFEKGYSTGHTDGREYGKTSYDMELLESLGTEQSTAVEAVAEINTTLAATLTDKGVEADATETTEALVGKASGIKTAEPWIYEWARQCTFTGKLTDAEITEIGDLNFEKATEVTGGLFQDNPHITKVGNITAPLEVGRYGASAMFYICTNLLSVGDITLYGVTTYNSSGISRTFSNCAKLQTAGFIDAPNYIDISYLCTGCVELVTFGGFKCAWLDGQSVFSRCSKLREITHPIDFTSCIKASEMFRACYALEEVRFVAGAIKVKIGYLDSCKVLSDASIQSWVDGLADLTGQTAVTQTLHADVKARLTEAQIATVTAKNWTIA